MTVPTSGPASPRIARSRVPVDWRAPEPGRHGVIELLGEELRANPGQWAVMPTVYISYSSAKNAASLIRRGKLPTLGDGPFEATSQQEGGDYSFRVYVRYVPEVCDEIRLALDYLNPAQTGRLLDFLAERSGTSGPVHDALLAAIRHASDNDEGPASHAGPSDA